MTETVYRGRSKATLKLLEACQEIIEATQPITVRGVCYRLFVAKLIDSMEKKNTQKISRLLVWAREEEIVEWDSIVDESRQMEAEGTYTDLAQYGRCIESWYRRDFWAHQPWRVVVISEKATVSGILRPVLEEYGVPFFAAHGFNSATKVHELAEEIVSDWRMYIFLYVGDYDCSGMHMSDLDLPDRLERYGAVDNEATWDSSLEEIAAIEPNDQEGFGLVRIALTEEDTNRLPSFPAKKDDPRYSWYVENYGKQAWELDAMNPNELRDRVRQAIRTFIDPGEWRRHKEIEKLQRDTTKRIAAAMTEAGAN
jgi:hypothetical protein